MTKINTERLIKISQKSQTANLTKFRSKTMKNSQEKREWEFKHIGNALTIHIYTH